MCVAELSLFETKFNFVRCSKTATEQAPHDCSLVALDAFYKGVAQRGRALVDRNAERLGGGRNFLKLFVAMFLD